MSYNEKEYQKQYRINNREKIAAKKKEWRERNLEVVKEKEREYRQLNWPRLRELNENWRRNNPEKMSVIYRRRNLRVKYGMTEEAFNKLIADQNGVCAICEQPERIEGRPLSVDHNHDTGKIRGLLCNDCNRNLIAQRDDPEIFYRAAAYLEKTNQQ